MPATGGEVGVLIGSIAKIAGWLIGWLVTFVTGVVTATWIVSRRVQKFEDRLETLEMEHKECQGKDGALQQIGTKLDAKLDRVHERIDDIYAKLSAWGGK